jgi:hypothetical protein
MTATQRNFAIIIAAFAFVCLTLSSCSHHTCPTYSQATEQSADHKG